MPEVSLPLLPSNVHLVSKQKNNENKNIHVQFRCGRTSTYMGHQHTQGPVCWSTQPGVPIENPFGSADPDTDVPQGTDKQTNCQLLWTHQVCPTKLTQKCSEILASPLELHPSNPCFNEIFGLHNIRVDSHVCNGLCPSPPVCICGDPNSADKTCQHLQVLS